VTVNDKKHSLRVVGRALSPEYVYMIRNVQELMPDPHAFGILWAPERFAETALDMRRAPATASSAWSTVPTSSTPSSTAPTRCSIPTASTRK
jgi:hypothetical protein